MGKRVSFRCNGFTDLDLADMQAIEGIRSLSVMPRRNGVCPDPHLLLQCTNGNRITIMRSLSTAKRFDLVVHDDNGCVTFEDEEMSRRDLMCIVTRTARLPEPAARAGRSPRRAR